jgi:MFS family permease
MNYALSLYVSSVCPIIGAQSLIGIATSLIPPSIAAVTLGIVGRQAFPKRVTINETFVHAGTVFTILTIGVLAQFFGHSWIVYGTMIFSALSLIPLCFINPHEINHSVARELPNELNDNSLQTKPISFLVLVKMSPLWIFFSSVIIFHFANAAQLPLVGQELAAFDPHKDSIYMASCIVIAQMMMVIVAYSLGFVINNIGRKPIYLFAFIILILRAALFSVIENSNLLLVIQLLDGMSAGIFGVLAVVMVSDLAVGTGRFNFLIGVLWLCLGIGSAMSNIIAGYITKIYGFQMGFIFLACAAAVGFIIYMFLLPETRRNHSDAQGT